MKYFLLPLYLTWCASVLLFAQESKPYQITNIQPSGDNLIISYNHFPVGDAPDAEYEVSVRLTRESDKNFSMVPAFLSGDIGTGKFTGSNRKITWQFKKQFPKGMPYDDVDFELTITKVKGIGSWVYYVGGAAVLGAGAVFLLKPKKEEENGTLPAPPSVRPN